MNTCISRFGIRLGDRKYLNEYTPFGSVSLWFTALPHIWFAFLSPPVPVAWWAHMHRFLSVCLSVCVYSGYIMHHYNGIWDTCAPGRRNMHHQGARCTMVHKGDYIFWKIQGTLMIFFWPPNFSGNSRLFWPISEGQKKRSKISSLKWTPYTTDVPLCQTSCPLRTVHFRGQLLKSRVKVWFPVTEPTDHCNTFRMERGAHL